MARAGASLSIGHHCVYDIHYHFVFALKYRKALLDEEVVARLWQISQEIQERYSIEIECFGTDRDHIHLLCSAHPKLAPGAIVRIYKSLTARELFKSFPSLKKQLWGGEFWSDGYFVATASRRGSFSTLKRYIQQQGEDPDAIDLRLVFPPADGDSSGL